MCVLWNAGTNLIIMDFSSFLQLVEMLKLPVEVIVAVIIYRIGARLDNHSARLTRIEESTPLRASLHLPEGLRK